MTKTTLIIKGMACKNCEAHVNEAIKENFSVKKVSSSHSENETVIISEKTLPHENLKQVITDAGYNLIEISEEEYVKRGLFS